MARTKPVKIEPEVKIEPALSFQEVEKELEDQIEALEAKSMTLDQEIEEGEKALEHIRSLKTQLQSLEVAVEIKERQLSELVKRGQLESD